MFYLLCYLLKIILMDCLLSRFVTSCLLFVVVVICLLVIMILCLILVFLFLVIMPKEKSISSIIGSSYKGMKSKRVCLPVVPDIHYSVQLEIPFNYDDSKNPITVLSFSYYV